MEELSKSIVCLEQIIDDKQTKLDGAKWRITIAEPVLQRLANGTLTAEEAVELLKAQKMHDNAEKLIAVEQPLIEKLQKDLAELQLKQSKAGAGARGDSDGSTTSDRSVSSTINMIELRTKRELKNLELEFVEAKNKINDAIEDLEEELNDAISTTKKEENEKEIARLCKLLTRAERDYANKVDGIKNIAEIEKDRVIGERQQQMEQFADNESFKTTREDGIPVADNKHKSIDDWLHHGVLPEVPHGSPERERKRFNFYQQFPPPPRKLELPSPPANPNCAMDKDAMIIHLMQTQLGVMQRSQTSNADKKLPDFSGDPSDWGNFYAAYKRTQEKYNFEDSDNIARLQTALKGPAKEAVKHLLCNVANLQKIMEVLKMQFGRPEFVLDFLMAKAKSSKKPDLSKPETIVAFGRAVEDLVTNIAAYNEDDYMQNKQLVVELVEKMPSPMKDKWYTWLAKDDFRKTNLSNFSSWLSKQVKVAILQLKPTIVEEKSEEKPPPRYRRPPGTVNAADGEEKEPRNVCPVCSSKSHGIDNCWSLKKKTEDERWKLVREARVCFSCLKPGHMTKDCQEARKCGLDGCTRLHHHLLHSSSSKGAVDTKSKSDDKDGNKSDGSIGVAMSIVKGFDGPLPIVPVRLVGRKGETIVTYALLDSGATRTLIKRSLADKLDLQGPSVNYRYKLINGEIVENNSAKKVAFKISGKYRNAPTFHLTDAITVEKIGLSPYSLDVDAAKQEWSHLRRYKGPSLSNVVTEIVIGTDYGYLMMHKELLYNSIENPVGIRTVLGWAIQGKVKTTDIVGSSYCIGGISLDETLHQLVQQSFQLEDYGATESQAKSMSIEDKRALKMLEENSMQRPDGRWETTLLWKNVKPFPNDGYDLALQSLRRADKRMSRDEKFAEANRKKIQEYQDKGYIRKLSEDEAKRSSPNTRYISHFGVINPNKPGKFRLVFNAAEKAEGVSLNDRLLSGPDLLKPLPAVLSNFRCHPVVICGDIEDMFHRIYIKEEDRCAQRFLWRDGNMSKEPEVYEMQVMIFGATSSPATAIYIKDRNADLWKNEYPEAVKAIQENMYCDDLLCGTRKAEEAIKLRAEVNQISESAGMVIKKWISNNEVVMKSIPEELRLNGAKSLEEKTLWNAERILGLWWDPIEDTFGFKLNFSKVKPDIVKGAQPTKRQMCSLLMSLFDPLGFVGQYRIKGMILLQKVWAAETDWDDFIPEDVYDQWKIWLEEMHKITDIKIPRYYNLGENAEVQMHTFVDASSEGFCAVSYFRIIGDGLINVSFVAARVKVAPKKKLTIPRLELEAAVLGSKLATKILQDVKVKVDRCYFWSDSSTVLKWIASESCRYKEFVANRISKVQRLTNPEDWRWISTKDNVADDGTRSDKKSDLSSGSRWLQGPAFLMQEEDDWPKKEETGAVSMAAGDDENETDAVTTDVTAIKAVIPNIERYSNYYRLIRATAAVSAAARYWLAKTRKSSPKYIPWMKSENGLESNISAGEFLQAERKLIIFVQHEYRGNMRINSSKFQTMKDEYGIIRMVGRIDNAKAGEEVRRPILLPAKNHLVDILIDLEHIKNAHTGRNTVYNNLRQRFWIPDGRHAVRRSWTRCYHCRIRRAKPVMPEMGELPSFRLESHSPPFTYTGVDMFGPIEVTVGRHHEKRWGMLFTCMVTRGIHLEVTNGLSLDATMMAMSRFVDSRGLPKHMYSDNGTNFQALANYLQGRAKYMHLQWHFIPPASPHMGGAWESMVKLVKKALYNILKALSPRDQVLLTAFKAVEFIVNSRPLGFVSADQDDLEMLTPNHFLRGVGVSSNNASSQAAESGSSDLPGEIKADSLKWGKQWEKAQAIAKMFWDRWSKEVLPSLLRRNKWNVKKDSIQVGEIVLMVDDQKPRGKWSKAVVTNTFPGKDGVVRVVEVTTRNVDSKTSHTFKRAVSKVCPLGLRMDDLDPNED